MTSCPSEVADKVFSKFSQTPFVFKDRVDAAFYFGPKYAELGTLLEWITNQKTKKGDISAHMPIGYMDASKNRTIHYDFSSFIDWKLNTVESLENDLTYSLVMKALKNHLKTVTVFIVIPYLDIAEKSYKYGISAWERAAPFFKNGDKDFSRLSVIINNIPADVKEVEVHTNFMQYLSVSRQDLSLFTAQKAVQKTARDLMNYFQRNNERFPSKVIFYNSVKKNNPEEIQKFVNTQLESNGKPLTEYNHLQNDKLKDYLDCLRKRLVTSICQDYQPFSQKMQSYFDNKIAQFDQLDTLKKQLQQWAKTVDEINTLWDVSPMDSNSLSNLLVKMTAFIEDKSISEQFLGNTLGKYVLVEMTNLLLTDAYTDLKPGECVKTASENSAYLKSWISWLDFLKEVDKSFMERDRLDVQSDRYLNKLKSLDLTDTSYNNYKNLLKIISDECCDAADSRHRDQLKINLLFKLVEYKTTVRNQVTCKNNKLIITGDVIQLSIVSSILDNKTSGCMKNIEEVEMYATQQIDINDDFFEKGLQQLTIFSPIWKIRGPAYILLEGSDAAPLPSPTATHGLVVGADGADGRAGGHGGHGGHFLGVAQEFMFRDQGSSLTINANGANGSAGQNGGNGRDGRQSSRLTYFIYEIKTILKINYFYFVHFDHEINYTCAKAPMFWREMCEVNDKGEKYRALCSSKNNCSSCQLATNIEYPNRFMPDKSDWWSYAQTVRLPDDQIATSGGNGGNGGLAGKGGNAGKILIVDFNLKSPSVTIKAENGTDGVPGKGGKGGKGGKEHDKMLCYNSKEYARLKGVWTKDGVDGTDNTMMNGWREQSLQKNFNLVPYIEQYKWELRAKTNNPFQYFNTMTIIEKLENSKLVNNYYTLPDYITAFTNLEKQFFRPSNNKYVLKFYELLYNRVNKIQSTAENAEVLPFLRAALFTKIVLLKKITPDNLIVNFKEQFKLLLKSVTQQKEINEIVIINQDKVALIGTLEEKISEAENLVRTQVSTAIETNIKDIENQIKNFVMEINEARKTAEDESMQMQTLEKKLQSSITLNLVLGVLNSVSSLLSLLGPVGAIASAVSGGISQVVSSFTQDSPVELSLPIATAKLANEIGIANKDLRQYRSNVIQMEIDKLQSELANEQDAAELVKNVKELDDKLKIENEKPNKDFKKIKEIQDQQKNLIAKEEEEKDTKYSRNERIQEILGQFNDATRVVEASLSVYETYQADKEALNTIRQQIKDADANIQQIHATKNEIEQSVGTLLQTLSKDMKNVQSELKDKSKANLDVKRWNIQSRLIDLKMQLHKLTDVVDDKTIRDDIAEYISKLDMTMNVMINVYDRIETYQDQIELIDYIAAVNMAKSQLIYISDPAIRRMAEELLVVIRTNTIVWQYNIFEDQFKQAVFPYAKDFVQMFNPLVEEKLTTFNRNKIIATYTNKIKEMNARIQTASLEIKENSRDRVFGQFSSDYISSKPFYRWQRQEHHMSYMRILRGEIVDLFADISQSELSYSGVKFNKIHLNFKVDGSDQKHQDMLDEILKQFTITLIHSGDSYYRCDKDYYKIHTGSQTISYSYEKRYQHNKLDPVHYNNVYNYLKHGVHMLSPYTFWKIQLTTNDDHAFDELRNFPYLFELQLTGSGSYINTPGICSNMEGHYDDYLIEQNTDASTFRLTKLKHLSKNRDIDSMIEKYMVLKVPHANNQHHRTTRSIDSFAPPHEENFIQKIWKRSVDFISGWNSSQPAMLTHSSDTTQTWKHLATNYDLNSTLLLADVICRKLTNQKTNACQMNQFNSDDEQSAAIILTDAIDNIITHLQEEDLEHIMFDPVKTQSQLLRMIKSRTPLEQINNYIVEVIKQDIPAKYADDLESISRAEGLVQF